ncbi:MAG: alpha/beta fold hydrolase [Thermoanaerobaculia bacterium]
MRRAVLAAFLFSSCAHMTLTKFIDGPQGRLRVDDGGSGPALAVLFVHGNGANHNQWRHQLEYLRKTRRAVAFDLRGMGESDVPRNGDYSIDAMVDDVQAVADALHLSRFVIVGHSYGGPVVAAYATKHPERTAGVVYADAGGNVKVAPDVAAKFKAALLADKDKVTRQWFAPILAGASDAVKEEVFASVAKTPAEAFASALSGLLSFDTVSAVEAYHGPRLAIVAAPVESPASLHKQVATLAVVKMDGVSHWLMLDKPEEFNRILDQFLKEIADSG